MPSAATNERRRLIEEGRLAGGVIVHCQGGRSRAATGVLSYLLLKEHLSLEAAFRKVHRCRGLIHPNPGFWRQLRELEAELLWGEGAPRDQACQPSSKDASVEVRARRVQARASFAVWGPVATEPVPFSGPSRRISSCRTLL